MSSVYPLPFSAMKFYHHRAFTCFCHIIICGLLLLATLAHAQTDAVPKEKKSKPKTARTRGPNNDPGQKTAPIPPAELLPLLPVAPEGWTLTTSRAYNELTNTPRIMTFAKRDYKLPAAPAAPGTPGATPPQPQTLSLTILDIADEPERITDLTDLHQAASKPPAQATDLLEYYTLGDLGIRETAMPVSAAAPPGTVHGSRMIVAALRKRFLIVLKFTNTAKEDARAWLNRIDLAKLNTTAAVPRQREAVVPGMEDIFTLNSVDELNPKSNQTTKISRLSPEEMAKREASGRAQFKSGTVPQEP